MTEEAQTKGLLTQEDVERRLVQSRTSIYKLRQRGLLKTVKIGTSVRFTEESVIELERRLREEGSV